jgi:hypothetical protein
MLNVIHPTRESEFDPDQIMDHREIMLNEALDRCKILEDKLFELKMEEQSLRRKLKLAEEMRYFYQDLYSRTKHKLSNIF